MIKLSENQAAKLSNSVISGRKSGTNIKQSPALKTSKHKKPKKIIETDPVYDWVEIIIDGKISPKERPRLARNKTFTAPATSKDEKRIATEAKCQAFSKGRRPLTGPVEVDLTFIYQVPKSWTKKKQTDALQDRIRPTGRPDLDNLEKIVLDALNEVAFVDDSHVTDKAGRKRYGTATKTIIKLRSIKPKD